MLFPLGSIVATPGALLSLHENSVSPSDLLRCHSLGDWGDVDSHDRRANNAAVKNGTRILSSYPVGDDKVWIITEADRSSTCLLLPSEY